MHLGLPKHVSSCFACSLCWVQKNQNYRCREEGGLYCIDLFLLERKKEAEPNCKRDVGSKYGCLYLVGTGLMARSSQVVVIDYVLYSSSKK